MANPRITQLFANIDPTIKSVVLDTLTLEQLNITYERVPRIKEQIDEIVTRAAKKEPTAVTQAQGKEQMPE